MSIHLLQVTRLTPLARLAMLVIKVSLSFQISARTAVLCVAPRAKMARGYPVAPRANMARAYLAIMLCSLGIATI